MRFVDDLVEVDAHIDAEGQVRPLAFTWRGQYYRVAGIGRTHVQDDNRYFLVMTSGERVFELRWHIPDNRWFVTRAPGRRLMA